MTAAVAAVTTLTLAGARRVLEAAIAKAQDSSVAACIAVVDQAGNLLVFARMDGAPLLSASIAQDKAYTVAAFGGLPTHEWFDLIKDEPPLLHGIVKADRLVIFGGGAPIRSGAHLVGAIGVSGGSTEQDRAIAEAGAGQLP